MLDADLGPEFEVSQHEGPSSLGQNSSRVNLGRPPFAELLPDPVGVVLYRQDLTILAQASRKQLRLNSRLKCVDDSSGKDSEVKDAGNADD